MALSTGQRSSPHFPDRHASASYCHDRTVADKGNRVIGARCTNEDEPCQHFGRGVVRVLTFVASIPRPIAHDPDTRIPFQRRLVEALRVIPGVDAVAFANQLPLDGCCLGTNVYPEGRPADLMAGQRTSLMAPRRAAASIMATETCEGDVNAETLPSTSMMTTNGRPLTK